MTAKDQIAQIRIATPDDAHNLAMMHIASWHETYAGMLPDKILSALSVESRAAAEHDGTIIGFGSCGAQRTETLQSKGFDGEVSAIYVIREFQNRKIGTKLLQLMSSGLISRGFNAAALWVLRDNLRARRFYEHMEGQLIAEREDVRDDVVLVELAYGWRDLRRLESSQRDLTHAAL
jgi:GNAT superfamily N-acetyltransferase